MKIQLTNTRMSRRLTLWGWLLVVVFVSVSVGIWMFTIHDFLAHNHQLDAPILVVEGYVPDFVLDSVADIWKNTPSLFVVCAGLPIQKGEFCYGVDNHADYNSEYLHNKGVGLQQLVSAPALSVKKERTYTSALAAKEKLKELGFDSGRLNVVCLGTHARRSLLLYRKAFKPGWDVGVISYTDNDYPEKWWKTSEGARAVVYEMFAYLYCAIFFHP